MCETSEIENTKLLTFHNLHSEGITLSNDRTIARRTKDFGFVFSSQPIESDKKITIKLMEVSSRTSLASAFSFGITHTNPDDLDFNEIKNYTYLDLIRKFGFVAIPIDKKLCTRNKCFWFVVTSFGEILYEINNEKIEKFNKKIDMKKDAWAMFYFYENPISIKLIKGVQEKLITEEKLNKIENSIEFSVKKDAVSRSASCDVEYVDSIEERRSSLFGVTLKRANSEQPI